MPVDYESLARLGSIMGSGGMIVMDENSCMVDVAKYFMDFCMTRVLRQVRSLPRRHLPNAPHPERHHEDDRDAGKTWPCSRNSAICSTHQPVRPRAIGAQPGSQHAEVFCGGIQSPHRKSELPGWSLRQIADEETTQ